MTLLSRLCGSLFALPPPETRDVVVTRDLGVPMPDGIVLLADHYAPRGGGRPPTLLVRSPYGRAQMIGALFGHVFAERGFQVLIQSCRGTFGSGGALDPFHSERADGLATLAWIREQPWFSGSLATLGPSYLGFVQWAIAAEAGPELQAMSVQVSSSEMRSPSYAGESFWLDTALTWVFLVHHQEASPVSALLAPFRSARALRAVFRQLPLRGADEAAVGAPVSFFRDWLDHGEPGDPWWDPIDFSQRVAQVTAPIYLCGGWFDVFLPQTLADYRRLREAGRDPHLTIGPWTHLSTDATPVFLRESIAWFRAHLLGDASGLREAPVRVFVMGGGGWRDLAAWPPAGYAPERWHLLPEGGLAATPPVASAPERYRYDPADPTPAVGGSTLSLNAGPKDNRTLEARPDVLVFTSAPLPEDLEAMGPVTADLHVASSLDHTDFFVRLCDVAPSGKSTNVCDGLRRLAPGRCPPDAEGCRRVEIDLWPTAHRFARGHRIRVQISSGAHPRYARNPGSGEPLATATRLVAAEQTVYHDPARPSAILLPMKG
jgi:uncharacterized protein